jgi:NADPH:quinone reductase-like Zn-dependent oxidoreductase
VRKLGAIPVDYRDPGMYQRIRQLAPDGVHAMFDHVGGAGLKESWRLLRKGGTLVSYGTAATKNQDGNSQLPILKAFALLASWNLLPNGKSAHFYNFWAGKRNLDAFRDRLHGDLTRVLRLLADGVLTRRSPRSSRWPMPRRRWPWPSRAPSQAKSSSSRRTCLAMR